MHHQQQQQKLPPRPRPPSPSPSPTPRGFGVLGAAFSPKMRGIGVSQAQAAAAAAAARARVAEQMAYEDAWKASNPDFKTPFASVEDAVSRLLPYHVFADYEEDDVCDDDGDAIAAENLSAQQWDAEIEATHQKLLAEFEKQVLSFNVIVRRRAEGAARGEEHLMLDREHLMDDRRQTERMRATIAVEQQQEATRARQVLAQAQAQAASAWPLVQVQPTATATATAWQQALAAAAGVSTGIAGQMAAAQALAMHPQLQDPGARKMNMMQQQQQMQQLVQQQQMLDLGVSPTFVARRSEGGSSSNVQAGMPTAAMLQGQGGWQTTSGSAAAGAGMTQPRWAGGARRKKQ